ncbi:MAG: thermonuclease family protein [Rhizobiales bacterium]|nr:thermonuclease family protein [Hyphomicrobiales bacterium]
MYEYRAFITDVYDGDTITANIDLGFRTGLSGIKLRLYGINAPEIRLTSGVTKEDKDAGLKARDWLSERILNRQVFIRTHRDSTEKYGRFLAEVYPLDDHRMSFNQMLVDEGLAAEARY